MRLGKRKRHVAEKAYPTVREYSLRGVQRSSLWRLPLSGRAAFLPIPAPRLLRSLRSKLLFWFQGASCMGAF